MKDNIPDFIKDATNVYRTKGYIVKQVIGIQYDCKENNVVFSHDTFYKRTPKRDKEYEIKAPKFSGLSLWEKLWFCYGKLVNL